MTPERKQTVVRSAALTVHWLLMCDLLDNLGQRIPPGDARSWLPSVPQALTDFLTERLDTYLDTVTGLDEVDDADFGQDLAHHLLETGGKSGYFDTKGAPRLSYESLGYDDYDGDLFFNGAIIGPCPEVEAFILYME